MGSMAAGLRLATGTLTVIPVGPVQPQAPGAARAAMLLAPVAALPLAIAAGAVLWVGEQVGLPAYVVGVLVVLILAAGTRAMHLDGLADTVDGFGGGWTRERALQIMHTGDVGPMGVVALAGAFALQSGSIAVLTSAAWAPLLLAVVVCVSRCSCALLSDAAIPAATQTGMGAVMARTVPHVLAAATAVCAMAATVAVGLLAGRGWGPSVAAPACWFLTLVVLLRMSIRRIGGVTGDIYGASVELGLCALLVPLCAS